MKLIKEDISFNDMQVLSEGKGSDKRMYISGPFLQAVKENKNKRIYPEQVMDNAVANYQKDYIDEKRALGELNHPAEPIVNPERAAIMTESLKKTPTKEAIYYEGKAKVLSTPMGKIVENLLQDDVKIGVSSRGLGSLMPTNGINIVGEDFTLTTAADVVFDPSAQSSFVEGVYEQAEWIYESGMWKQIDLDFQREKLKRAKMKELNKVKLEVFESFLKTL
ncbi:MAG: primosomal protein [Porticoccaceae bacterium]|jgi:hypothetical protein|nr:primosomal protein [Porticoccaceae bacterium]|tara:strand:+ start:11617 stop:12279 length:663 start_codon:yes stop_codon:yes gene_type:complete